MSSYPPFATVDWKRAEDTLSLKISFLLSRLRIAILEVSRRPNNGDRTRNIASIQAELELIAMYYGIGSILGLALPNVYFLQELFLQSWPHDVSGFDKQASMINVVHSLLQDLPEDEARKIIHQYDPSGMFSWWVGGRVPSRQDMDLMFESMFIKLTEKGISPKAGRILEHSPMDSFSPPITSFNRFHNERLPSTKTFPPSQHPTSAGKISLPVPTESVIDVGAKLLVDIGPNSQSPSPAVQCLVPRNLLLNTIADIENANNLVEAALTRKLEAVSRSRWQMGGYFRLFNQAVRTGRIPYPSKHEINKDDVWVERDGLTYKQFNQFGPSQLPVGEDWEMLDENLDSHLSDRDNIVPDEESSLAKGENSSPSRGPSFDNEDSGDRKDTISQADEETLVSKGDNSSQCESSSDTEDSLSCTSSEDLPSSPVQDSDIVNFPENKNDGHSSEKGRLIMKYSTLGASLTF